jgi:hypothetical protein
MAGGADDGALHWIYGVYLFLCTLQLPLFLVVLASGHGVTCRVLEERADLLAIWTATAPNSNSSGSSTNNNNNNTNGQQQQQQQPLLVIYGVVPHSLEPELCLMSVTAGLFATMYMVRTGASVDPAPLEQEEEGGALAESTDGGGVVADETVRLGFWLFVWLQGWMQMCVTVYSSGHGVVAFGDDGGEQQQQQAAELIERLWGLNAVRLAALIGLCSSNPSCKRPFTHFLAWVAYATWWVAVLRDASRYDGAHPWLLLPQMAADAVLRLGHRYDAAPTVRAVLNCRLFFVACCASWTQLSIINVVLLLGAAAPRQPS